MIDQFGDADEIGIEGLAGIINLDNIIRTDEIEDIAGQYGFNATDLDETSIDSFGAFDAKTELKAGNFELVGFPSKQALDDYISDINFGRNESHPAICYAFQIHEDENK